MTADETDTSTVEQSEGQVSGGSAEELPEPGASEEESVPRYTVSDAQARQIAGELLEEARRQEEELVAALPQAQQDAIREIQRQLASGGWEVHPTSHWWGFAVHLNAKAAQDVADITEMIGDKVGQALGGTIGKVVEGVAKIRAALIRAVGKDYGCRLVSPWIAPGMLIPISSAPKEDTHLWWTVMESPSTGWSADEKFTGHLSKSNPALAVYNGKLYCVHRGDGDNSLWWTVYDPDTGWSADTRFPGHHTAAGPALAVYNGKLHCVHRGRADTNLWWTTFDGNQWSSPEHRFSSRSSHGPALAVHGDKLYLVFKGFNDNTLWWSTLTGNTWSGENPMSGRTNSNPALASFQGSLYAVYKGHNTNSLYINRFSGGAWQGDGALPGHASAEGPALAVYDNHLYCVHRGGSDKSLWWTRWNGNTWTDDAKFPGHYSAQGPAIVAYRDKYGTKNQLFCVHRGS